MKSSFPIAVIIALSALTVQAQITVETTAPQTKDASTSYFVDIPQADRNTTEKAWLKYVGKRSKGKASEVSGQYLQLGAVNKNISFEPFDVHSTMVEAIGGVRLTAWFTKNGAALASTDGANVLDFAAKKYLHDFAILHYRTVVTQELNTETSKLKTMEKSLAKIIKEGERSGQTINRNDRSGKRTTEAMTVSEQAIVNKAESIEDQRDMVNSTATDAQASKGANKTMDDLKDDKKDLQKLNESQGRELDDLNKDTRAAERDMSTSADRMTAMQAQIAVQRTVVADVKAKLAAIH